MITREYKMLVVGDHVVYNAKGENRGKEAIVLGIQRDTRTIDVRMVHEKFVIPESEGDYNHKLSLDGMLGVSYKQWRFISH